MILFDLYRDGQPIAVSIFENAIKENKISHAYLIDTNYYSKSLEFILDFIKQIIRLDIGNLEEFNNICCRIDNGNYTELKIIESDGNWIKKEQMRDLQDSFSLKGVEGNKRFYIIKDCEKMNLQTSNSILKFLEEPDDNVIAILMSNNISQLLDTIVSRCQLIRFNNDKILQDSTILNLCNLLCYSNEERDLFLKDEFNANLVNSFIKFIKYFEECNSSVIVDIKKLWHDVFNDRKYVDIALDLWINLYYDILRIKSGLNLCFFVDYEEDINYLYSLNKEKNILFKIDKLIEFKGYLKYNLNLNLFIDKLVIDLVGD